jgi:hypothetical protein
MQKNNNAKTEGNHLMSKEKEREFSDSQGYLLPEWFEINTRMSDNFIFIKLNHLEEMFKRDRKVYLRNLAKTGQLVRLEPKDQDIVLSRYLTYTLEMNDFNFAAGIVTVKIHNLWSYEGFDLRVAIKTDFRTRIIEDELSEHK